MALKIAIKFRNWTDEQYITAASNGLRIAGFVGTVWQVERTRVGAVVHFADCVAV